MIRRSPTRIDLRLDDLAEYEALKKEREANKDGDKKGALNPPAWGGKLSEAEIQERIGYVSQQTPQGSYSRPNMNNTL